MYICESELGDTVSVLYKNKTIHVPVNDTWTFAECFWWGLMTITTVGYDVNPNVRLDFGLGGLCAPHVVAFASVAGHC